MISRVVPQLWFTLPACGHKWCFCGQPRLYPCTPCPLVLLLDCLGYQNTHSYITTAPPALERSMQIPQTSKRFGFLPPITKKKPRYQGGKIISVVPSLVDAAHYSPSRPTSAKTPVDAVREGWPQVPHHCFLEALAEDNQCK